MAPAHQRLAATIAIAMEIVLGLQIDNKLAVFKGIFHLVDDLFFIADFFAEGIGIEKPALVLGGFSGNPGHVGFFTDFFEIALLVFNEINAKMTRQPFLNADGFPFFV